MPKFLTLMNPNRRRGHRRRLYGAALAAHQRKSGRRIRRRVRRNPSVSARPRRVSRRRHRPSPPKMTTAMRAKISRAVKAANRARAAHRSPVRRAFAMIRRPSFSRRRISRSSFGGGSLMSSFKNALSKDLLLKASGAVGASVLTGIVLNKYGSSLPMSSSKWGRVAYSVAIPITLAFVVRKKSRPLAEGMVIGGLVMGINAVLSQVRAQAGAVASYPGTDNQFAVAGELNRPAAPAALGFYPSAGRATLGVPMTGAFNPSAW